MQIVAQNDLDIEWLVKRVERLTKALEFYADKKNWKYTDCAGQYSWNTTMEDDLEIDDKIDMGGGTEYAGKHAREVLKEDA